MEERITHYRLFPQPPFLSRRIFKLGPAKGLRLKVTVGA